MNNIDKIIKHVCQIVNKLFKYKFSKKYKNVEECDDDNNDITDIGTYFVKKM